MGIEDRLRRAAAAFNDGVANRLVLECRTTGHTWPERQLADRTVGETDCCFRCGTTRTVIVESDRLGYRYKYPADYTPLR